MKKYPVVDEMKRGLTQMFGQTLTAGKVLLSVSTLALLDVLWFFVGMGWNEKHPATYWWMMWSLTLAGVGMALMLLAGERGTRAARLLMHSLFFIGALVLAVVIVYSVATAG